MKITEAIEVLLSATDNDCPLDPTSALYEARRIMTAQLRYLQKREVGQPDADPSKIADYQEYHYADLPDIGIAFNDTRAWICFSGVSVLRVKAKDDRLLTEFHPPSDQKDGRWDEKQFGSPERDARSKMRKAQREAGQQMRKAQREAGRRDKEIGRLKKKIERLER